MIRVVLAEDNRNLRRNLALRLGRPGDISVVGEASTHEAAVQLAHSRRAHLVLLDVYLSGSSGLAAIRTLATPHRDAPAVMVLTSAVAHPVVIEALDAGASAYLVRGLDDAGLVGAIRRVARGEQVLSDAVGGAVLAELVRRGRLLSGGQHPPTLTDLLSPAEIAVLEQLCSGATSNEQAAAGLGVSVNTVRSHLASCLRKLGLADRTQLALWGVRHGLGGAAGFAPPVRSGTG